MEVEEIVRVKTGIPHLDDLIEGGFPKKELILLAGYAGTGKTIFCTQFICNGAIEHNEKGVYATLEEDARTLKRNMKAFGYNFEKLEKEGKVRIIDIESLRGAGLSSNIQFILDAVANMKAERLAIASVTALLAACKERFDYRTLMHLFYRILKTYKCTTIMTCSIPTGQKTLGLGIEEFVADALLILDNFAEEVELKRRLLIQKMRGTNHSRKWHNVLITKQGLEIVPFAQV
jgi:KaiC/GvpD/RAD55 family RecA-like ATPase